MLSVAAAWFAASSIWWPQSYWVHACTVTLCLSIYGFAAQTHAAQPFPATSHAHSLCRALPSLCPPRSQLSLSMNNLASLPDSIGSISTLASLELSDNRLASLPGALGRLNRLASLSLRSNCLAALPAEVGGLGGLSYLDLSMNHVTVRRWAVLHGLFFMHPLH